MRYAPPYGGESIMVWEGISYTPSTELHVFDGESLTGKPYTMDILEPYVLPFAPYVSDKFVFAQDNAQPQASRCVADYLQKARIRTLNWPAYRPNLNPIEHV